jgi:hypothetical protein
VQPARRAYAAPLANPARDASGATEERKIYETGAGMLVEVAEAGNQL